MEKKELIGLSKEELTAELVNIGEKHSGPSSCGNGFIFAEKPILTR